MFNRRYRTNNKNELQKYEYLDKLLEASEVILSKNAPDDILQTITEQACEGLGASWASIVFLKNGRLEELNRVGKLKLKNELSYVRENGHTSFVIRNNKVVSIKDVDSYMPSQYGGIEINPYTINQKIRSVYGIPVNLKEQTVGVVWLHFEELKSLTYGEMQQFRMFVNQAASVYDNAQREQHIKAIENMVSLMTLDDNTRKLELLAYEIKKATQCDAISLYTYNADAGRLYHPPVLLGLKYPDEARKTNRVPTNSIVYSMLDRSEVYVVDNTQGDKHFFDRPFVKREGIKSLLVYPLRNGTNKLGVLFINFRNLKIFSEDDLKNAGIYAKYVLVATQNSQDFARQRSRARALKSIYLAGNLATTFNFSVDNVLMEIAQQAVLSVGFTPQYEESHRCFSHVAVIEGSKLIFKAASPYQKTLELLGSYGVTGLEIETKNLNKRKTIAGRAVLKKETLNVGNVEEHTDYVRISSKTKSQLSVPIMMNNSVLGVISIEHPAYNAFDLEDVENIQALAAWAATAIQQTKLEALINKVNQTSILEASDDPYNSLLNGIKEISECDIVEIHLFDELNGCFFPVPIRANSVSTKIARNFQSELFKKFIESDDRVELEIDLEEPDCTYVVDDFFATEKIKATRITKLIVANKMQGLLFLDYYTSHNFDSDELRILKLLSDHAAAALHNIYLLEQERKTRLLYESFQEISVVVTSKSNLEKVANLILEEMKKVISYNKATMQLIRNDGSRDLLAYKFDDHLINNKLLGPIKEDVLISKIVGSQEILVIPNTSASPDWDSDIEETKDVLSWIGAPLVFRNEVVGLITLDSNERFSYSETVKKTLVSFTNQAAYAIANTKLIDEINTYAETLKTIHSMGMDTASSAIEELNPTVLFEKVYHYFQRLFPKINNFYIAEYARGTDLLSFPFAIHNGNNVSGKDIWVGRNPDEGLTEYVLNNSEALLLSAYTAPSFSEWQSQYQIKPYGKLPTAWAGVPLIVGERTIGVIATYHFADRNLFEPSILEILEVFGSHVAIALEYARTRAIFKNLIGFLTNLHKIEDADDIIIAILIKIVEVIESEVASICLLVGDNLVVKEIFNNGSNTILNPPGTKIKKDYSVAWLAIETESLSFSNSSPTENMGEQKHVFCENADSSIAAPLFRDGKVIGVLIVENIGSHHFEKNKKWTNTLMKLFADVTSSSLQMAQYIENERRIRDSLAIADSAIVGGALAKSVLHELNNGISSVDHLLFEINDVLGIQQGLHRQKQLLSLLESARQHLQKISVDPQVLAFTGRLSPRYTLMSMNEIVESSAKFVQAIVRRQNISFDIDLDSSLNFGHEINIDESQIRQVIVNLVLNAIDAYHGQKVSRNLPSEINDNIKPIGKIIFRTRAMKTGAQFELEDFAAGIPEEVESKLFEPFVTSKSEGSGLGLYISREIIEENHKGEIYYKSKGRGTIFVFRIPYAAQL